MKKALWILALMVLATATARAQAVVSGNSVQVTAEANDDDGDPGTVDTGVASVEFFFEGSSLGAGTQSAPLQWSLVWNTLVHPNGVGNLTARACDVAGNCSTSAPHPVDIENVDVTPPTVEILEP